MTIRKSTCACARFFDRSEVAWQVVEAAKSNAAEQADNFMRVIGRGWSIQDLSIPEIGNYSVARFANRLSISSAVKDCPTATCGIGSCPLISTALGRKPAGLVVQSAAI